MYGRLLLLKSTSSTRWNILADMITGALPFRSIVTGLSTQEKDTTHAWRWGDGKELKFTFKSEAGLRLRLSLRFTSPFAKQHITIEINSKIIDKLSEVEENFYFKKEYDFKSASDNTISLTFAISSKDIQAFPQDSRDLTALFYEFLVKGLDARPLTFS